MSAALVIGVAAGFGLMVTVTGLFPIREPLADALRRLDATPDAKVDTESKWVRTVGSPAARSEIGRAFTRSIATDLRLLGRTADEHMARLVAVTAIGFLCMHVTTAALTLAGIWIGIMIPVWMSLAIAAVAVTALQVSTRSEAARRRRSFRHALGCYLDLVSVRLAGGAGIDAALSDSSRAGDGWAFGEIRQALTDARLRGEPAWHGLARLGGDIGVTELEELAASTGLAGDEGARVRRSITAKARALRVRGLADAEAAAQAASERMSLPVVLLMTGFIAFLGYPAVAQVLNGL